MSDNKQVLITGGLGFIGSHTAVVLLEKGYEVVIVDDLSNSNLLVLEGIEAITGRRPKYHNLDLRKPQAVQSLFQLYPELVNVIHFAASKAVGESVLNPLLYYENNVNSLVYVLKELSNRINCNFIFSSSCTVYGQALVLPVTESAPVQNALSPYGNTKQIGEEIINDHADSQKNFRSIILRYFNPIGAHSTGLIGELPNGIPQNLVPFVTQTAAGLRTELLVYGGDYDTLDGSGIRDYIHVMDLAEAHLCALERLQEEKNKASVEIFNIGTGEGSSVLEVVKTFIKTTGISIPYKITERRPGDIMAAYADNRKAQMVLKWKPSRSLATALNDAWNWEKKLKDTKHKNPLNEEK